MKTLLITGSNGLVGQKLIDTLLHFNRFKIIATSKGANRHSIKGGYVYEELDITNKEQIEEVFSKHKPDVIIHTAAITNADICHQQNDLCRLVNVEAVSYLAKACKKYNSHLIYLSTDFVFDGENGPYSEDANPNPISFYGQSKLDGENVIINSGCHWAIIRTILVYGVLKDMSRTNIVLWAKGALEKGEEINVVNDQWRMPTLAEDLAECCMMAAEKSAQGIFHVSGKDWLSIIEIVENVAEYWQLDKSIIHPISSASLNQPAKRPQKTGFVLDKAIRELGYRPHSFKEGLAIVDKQLKEI